jgi:N-acyl-D-amino-acid deacylase
VTLFRGATVVDGTGGPAFRADVTVSGGRIAEVGPDLSGRPVVDATGLVLTPGFVDMHAHSDLALLTAPEHAAKVSQGVTCEVLGQDGLSYAPVSDRTLGPIRQQIAGWHGDPPGFDWNWRSVAGYLDRLDAAGTAVNTCYLVPHGNVRALVLGWDPRPPTPAELDRMRSLVATGLAAGAFGLSAGLTYPPGMYADTAELVELCRVVAGYGGFFDVHHRSYGAGALDAYAEMIDVSRRAGCALHLAHATMNFPVNAGRAGDLLALLADGDVTVDSYPYLAGPPRSRRCCRAGPRPAGRRRRSPGWPRRRSASGSGSTWRNGARTATTVFRSTGTRSRSRGYAKPGSPVGSVPGSGASPTSSTC